LSPQNFRGGATSNPSTIKTAENEVKSGPKISLAEFGITKQSFKESVVNEVQTRILTKATGDALPWGIYFDYNQMLTDGDTPINALAKSGMNGYIGYESGSLGVSIVSSAAAAAGIGDAELGAEAGAALGPGGIVAGAILGFLIGYLVSSAADKAYDNAFDKKSARKAKK
jgi:hypothetical protein